MSEQATGIDVMGIQWRTHLPGLRLFGAFRMAIHHGKIALALMLVVLLYLGGVALEWVCGPQVHPGEVEHYIDQSPEKYQDWLSNQESAEGRRRIFETALDVELRAFQQLVDSAVSLDFGLRSSLAYEDLKSGGVLGALGTMFVVVPGWLYQAHTTFLVIYVVYAFALWALFGGAIARLAALHASRDIRVTPFQALRFSAQRYIWFVTAPLLPLVGVLLIGLLLALGGLVFFNLPVLDLVGSLLFVLGIFGGLIIAVLLIGLAFGFNLLLPAVAIEGTDAFDAVSRAFNYALGRPWRYLLYNAVALVYGAIIYLVLAFVLFVTIWVTKTFVGLWAFADAAEVGNRFDAILPDPQLGNLRHGLRAEGQGTVPIAAAVVNVWVKLLIAILPAFWISYYISAETWIYLLLRRVADGAEFDDVYLEPEEDAPPIVVAQSPGEGEAPLRDEGGEASPGDEG